MNVFLNSYFRRNLKKDNMNSSNLIRVLFLLILSTFAINKCEASKKYNRYLAHIFNKYGSGGTMPFEVRDRKSIRFLTFSYTKLCSS